MYLGLVDVYKRQLMVELSESRTVAFLVVTHDPTMLHHFDRVLTLTGGGLEESKPSEA